MWVKYVLGQIASIFLTLGRMVPLVWNNHFARTTVPTSGDVVISLTTHGSRLRTVFYTLESLMKQDVPCPVVVWLDEADFHARWPRALRRLARRGVQIKLSGGNYGPHTKYWNQFVAVAGTGTRVITVDDDMIYPSWLTNRLLEITADRQVVAFRAHRVVVKRHGVAPGLTGLSIAPYKKWKPVLSTTPSLTNFATGVSGVLYPASFIDFVVANGADFMDFAPRADDVWLHVMAVRSNHPIRQVGTRPRNFACIPSAQLSALVMDNLGGGNDEQIAATYTADDIARLA